MHEEENLAYKRPVIFSGANGSLSGEGAVDGVDSCQNPKNCFIGLPHVNGFRNWLAVDLGSRTMIRYVTLYERSGMYNYAYA